MYLQIGQDDSYGHDSLLYCFIEHFGTLEIAALREEQFNYIGCIAHALAGSSLSSSETTLGLYISRVFILRSRILICTLLHTVNV
jgi:hypothetical protein